MPVTVERISRYEVSGWACDDFDQERALAIRVRLGGEVIGEALADRPQPQGGRNRRPFSVHVDDLGDIVSALADGDLTVEALRDSSAGDAATPITATFERHLLSHETLRTAHDLFGGASLNEVLDRLQTIARRSERGVLLAAFCFDLVCFIRAYFPAAQRDSRFYALAVELSRVAGMVRATHFYEQRLAGDLPPDREVSVFDADELGERQVLTYALPGDLVRFAHLPVIDLVVPPFINGQPDDSFLLRSGVINKAAAETPMLRVHGFRVNGFGDNDWSVLRADGRVLVAEKLYRADFEALRGVIDAGGILVLDMTAEGPPCLPRFVEMLNAGLSDLGIPPSQVLLITQNLAFSSTARQQGLRATTTTGHYYLKRGADIVAELYGSKNAMLDYMKLLLSRRKKVAIARKYMCLNYTPRWPRWATVLSLFCNGHLDTGYVSFPGGNNRKLTGAALEAYRMPNIRNRERYLERVPEFMARCPLVVDVEGDSWPAPDFVFPTKAFENSFLHIVTETEMSDGSVLRVTEKILKPIVGMQPFLVVGNAGSLQLMRELGFRTFPDIFDEGYDAIGGIPERFNAVEAEILRVLEQEVATLQRMTEQVADTLVHNFVHLVSIGPLLFGVAVEARLRAVISAMVREVM